MMFKWMFFTIAAIAALANAYTITYNYTGAEGGSCTSDDVKDSVTVKCSAPSGYTWASASLKGEGSSIWSCVPDSCVANIQGDATINIGFEKSEDVRKISWIETGYGRQDIPHGYAAVTDLEKTKFLLAATVGDSVKMTPIPAERYHWKKWYDRSGSARTEIKTEDSVYVFEMPDMNLSIEAEFDYNNYLVVADMNGGPGRYLDRFCSSFDDCYLWKDSAQWDGHIFQGWMLDKDAKDTFFIPFARFSEPLSVVQLDSVVMYAKWFEAKIPQKVNGCYQIGNENELYGFAYLVSGKDGYEKEQDACGELTADIVVNKSVLTSTDSLRKDSDHLLYWVPIGTAQNPFMGKFNGKGHTISGLYLQNSSGNDIGLFGVVQSTEDKVVSIDSVGVIASYFEGKDHVGGLVGNVEKKTNLSINHSYTDMTITGRQIGGLVSGNNDSVKIAIDHSYHSGKMYPNTSTRDKVIMGGLIAQVDIGSSVTISNSNNKGSIDITDYTWVLAGGIIGYVIQATEFSIDKSFNAAKITGNKNNEYAGGRDVGGLIGHIDSRHGVISNSYNVGDIDLNSGEYCTNIAGGLLGPTFVDSLEVSGSYNSASITADIASGLVAEVNTYKLTILTSHNDGKISAVSPAHSMASRGGASGLVGVNENTTIINSYNIGQIEINDTYYKKTIQGGGFSKKTESLSIINSYNMSENAFDVCQALPKVMNNVFFRNQSTCEGSVSKNTPEEFANGTVAWELYNYSAEGVDGHVWGQKVGTDPYPLLNGAGVEGYDGGRTAVAVKLVANSFTLATSGNTVKISGAAVGARFHVLDVQGRIISVAGFAGPRIRTSDFEISLPNKGRYLITIGGITRAVTIK